MNTLDCLIYLSTCKLTPDESEQQLADIVRISALLNSQAGITGILTLQEGYFVQLLEGPPAALDLLMLHLHFDQRHEDICVVARERILARDVLSWSMIAPEQLTAPDTELIKLLAERTDRVEPWRNALLQLLGEPPRPLQTVLAA